MSNYPDNWDTMGAIARHKWSVKQSKVNVKPDIKTAEKPRSDLPENWESMSAIARHEFMMKSRREDKTNAILQHNPLTIPTNGVQEQYYYWSTMIKSDNQSLKSIIDHAERDKRKPSLLNKYREYLTEYMAAKETHDNNVLFYCLVWACDCEQWEWAIELCDYATATHQTNDVFKRGHEDVCADQVFYFAEKCFKSGVGLPACFIAVFERITEEKWTVDAITQSKYYKLIGDTIIETLPNDALTYFKKAQELNNTIGVKGRIKTLEESS